MGIVSPQGTESPRAVGSISLLTEVALCPQGVVSARGVGTIALLSGRILVPRAITGSGIAYGFQDRDNFIRNLVTVKW